MIIMMANIGIDCFKQTNETETLGKGKWARPDQPKVGIEPPTPRLKVASRQLWY
jgi:hypothetical protein